MANLSTLVPDVRLEIVRLTMAMANSVEVTRWQRQCQTLSLVCRALNETCASIIFHTYYLDLRWPIPNTYPPGSLAYKWDEASIKVRLAHLESKAPFVRKLIITDLGEQLYKSSKTAPEAFPFEFIPELLVTLRQLRHLTSVHLVTHSNMSPSIPFPMDIWNWLLEVQPQDISIGGNFEVTPDQTIRPIESLDSLSLQYRHPHVRHILDIHCPKHIQLEYSGLGGFSPVMPTDPLVETIYVEFSIWEQAVHEPLFDFSRVPQAIITIRITFNVEHEGYYPSAWKSVKPVLQLLFVEDLCAYDVLRSDAYIVQISRRPEEDWKPRNQDHIGKGKDAYVDSSQTRWVHYGLSGTMADYYKSTWRVTSHDF